MVIHRQFLRVQWSATDWTGVQCMVVGHYQHSVTEIMQVTDMEEMRTAGLIQGMAKKII